MAVVTELVTVFKFKGSLGKLDKFRGGVKSSLKLLGGFTVALGAAGAGLIAFTTLTLKSAEAIGQLARETGDSVERLQQYGFAASVSGSSVEALNSSVSGLTAKIGEAAQKGSEEFSRLGINIRGSNGEVKTSLQVMEDLRQRFKALGLSLQEQRKFTDALGIDSSVIQLLNKTSSEMATLTKRASDYGVLTKKETEEVIKFQDSMTELKFATKAMQQQFALALAPEITRIIGLFGDMTEGSKSLIKDGFKDIITIAGSVIDTIMRLGTFIGDIIEATIGWKATIVVLSAILLAILSPFWLTVAAVIAVLAVIDDLIVAFQGGKSVIRDFFLEFFGWDITPFLKDFVGSFKNVIQTVKNLLTPLFDFLSDAFSQALDVIKVISGAIGFIFGDDEDTKKTQGSNPSKPTSLGVGTGGPTGGNNVRTDISQDVRINVETNNPELAGRTINEALQNEYRTAAQQTGRGGR